MCEPERRVACDGSLPEPDIRRRFLLWRSVPSPTSHPICICPALPRPLTALLHLGHADPLARPLPAARPRRMPMRNGAGKRDASFAGSSGVNPLHSWYNLFLSLILLDFRVPVLFVKGRCCMIVLRTGILGSLPMLFISLFLSFILEMFILFLCHSLLKC